MNIVVDDPDTLIADLKNLRKSKRPLTGYLTYAEQIRIDVSAELAGRLEKGTKLQSKDTVREIASRWKGEPQAGRDYWNTVAKTRSLIAAM